MDRRKFCLSSVATAISGAAAGLVCLPAAGQSAPPIRAASCPSVRLYKFIYDCRYPAGRAFGVAAEHVVSKAGTVAIDGDITALWSRELRAEWSAGGGAIAGMATARTLFCLEQLAQDHWMRVVIRAEHATSGAQKIAHRVTASEPMVARMKSVLAANNWPTTMPACLATFRSVDGSPRVTRMVGPGRGRPCAMTDEMLVSFVIA
jgi:hypothetical protein